MITTATSQPQKGKGDKALNNQAIRDSLTRHNMKQWELADLLNITEFSLCRKLRHELPADEQKRIVAIIAEHATEKQTTG